MGNILGKAAKFLTRNSSTILTCIGAAGVVATTVTAVKATPKALAILDEAKQKKGSELTAIEAVRTVGPMYIPSALIGISTIACIFGANTLNKRQQASLMSAYALLDTSYRDYKKKVRELYGDDMSMHIRKEIAKDRYIDSDATPEDGEILFYDELTEQYFNATMERVRYAEYTINRALAKSDYVCLNEWCDALGIDHVSGGRDLIWHADQIRDICSYVWIEFYHDKFVLDDGLEGYIISMSIGPTIDYIDD